MSGHGQASDEVGQQSPALAAVADRVLQAKAWATKYRMPIFLVAAAWFVVGCTISFRELSLDIAAFKLAPLLTMVFAAIPLSVAYSAINMMLMAKAAKVTIGFGQGVKISVLSQVAEMLPLPGGAIVRTAALIRAGSSTVGSIELVVAFALLWIGVGAIGAGLPLLAMGWPAIAIIVGGLAVAAGSCGWLAIRYNVLIAFFAVSLRIVGVALVAWRLSLAFAIIGIPMFWLDALTFAFATIFGATAAIVPAGLGVSEGISALVAGPAGIAAAAAFSATALSRIAGFSVNAAMALLYLLGSGWSIGEPVRE